MINKFNNAGDGTDVGTTTSTLRVAKPFYRCDTAGRRFSVCRFTLLVTLSKLYNEYMKNLILFLAFTLGLATHSYAAEKIHLVNSLSTTGSFNAIMNAYSKDLSAVYDVDYIQGSNCQKAKSIVDNLVNNKQSVVLIWQGLITAEYLDKQDSSCIVLPTDANFVRADLKHSVLYGLKGIDPSGMLSKEPKKVGYNSKISKYWLEQFAQHHELNWSLIQYKNSTEGYLGVLNKEIDMAYANSAATFWKNADKLTGLYSLNPNGDSTIPALKSISDFRLATAAQADFILYYGPDITKFRTDVRKIHLDENSSIVQFYKIGGSSYVDTLTLPPSTTIDTVTSAIMTWRQVRGN